MIDLTPLALWILREGLDDWVAVGTIDRHARGIEGSPRLRRKLLLATVNDLVLEELAEVGNVQPPHECETGETLFVPWKRPVGERLKTTIESFELDDDSPAWHYSFWLNNTAAGDRRARVSCQ